MRKIAKLREEGGITRVGLCRGGEVRRVMTHNVSPVTHAPCYALR